MIETVEQQQFRWAINGIREAILPTTGPPTMSSTTTPPTQTGDEITFSLGAVCESLGLTPELVRSWERRHGAVKPKRTPGGTRRFTSENVERLRLLKTLVDQGQRIGKIAKLPTEELKQRASTPTVSESPELEHILQAVEKMDAAQLDTLLRFQLSTLGSVQFAEQIGLPLLHEVGRRWSNNEIAIAAEHLLSNALRTLMGVRNLQQPNFASWPTIVFACPTNERHEFGLLFAALVAESAGCKVIYLGVDLPVEEMIHAVKKTQAKGLALSLVTLPESICTTTLTTLRERLPSDVAVIAGGPKAQSIENIPGVEKIGSLERFVQRIRLMPRPAF